MAKRKFDESKVKRDKAGRFARSAGVEVAGNFKQHDLKAVMNNRLGSGNSKNVRMSAKPPQTTGPGKKRSNTHPKQGGNLGHVKPHSKQGGNLGHVKTHKARKWGLR